MTEMTKTLDVLLTIGVKQWCYLYVLYALFILHTLFMQLSVACNLILSGNLHCWISIVGGLQLSHRCSEQTCVMLDSGFMPPVV